MYSTIRSFTTFALLAFSFVTVSGLFLSTEHVRAAGPQCTSPYVEQGTGILPNTGTAFNIEYVSVGEPFVNCTKKQLTFVLKVATMNPVPPQGRWLVNFLIPANKNTSNIATTLQVGLDSSGVRAAAPAFILSYSRTNPTTGTGSGGVCTAASPTGCPVLPTGTVAPDGTITFNLDITNTIGFPAITGGDPAWSIDPSAWGTFPLTQITGETDQIFGVGLVTEFDLGFDATDPAGTYTLQGNLACSAPPVAALAAVPTSGSAPLTVNFDASASTPGQCGTISSYNFNFGDGQQVSLAGATTSHTYTTGGATYHARLTVTSTSGLTSGNTAQQDITVNTAGPPLLTSVASRKNHAGVDYDIVLPQPPNARAIECRSGGASDSAQLVFTFLNNLTSVASAGVTNGAGSVLPQPNGLVLGPNPNQCTVNLTGVTNAQSTTVTLTNALDSTGASGSVSGIVAVLVGDVNGSENVDAADVGQVQRQNNKPLTTSNFRMDVNVSGNIDAADVGQVQRKNSTHL